MPQGAGAGASTLIDETDALDPNGNPIPGPPVTTGVNTGCGSNLTGIIRDFHDTHPDMEVCVDNPNTGVVATKQCSAEKGIVGPTLSADERPVYAGDPTVGTLSTTGQANFDQWWRDVPGVNTPVLFTLNFTEQTDATGNTKFVFDSDNPPPDSPPGFFGGQNGAPPGFFPIDALDQDGFNRQSKLRPDKTDWYGHNYHFTFEFKTDFTYRGGEVFRFRGDDDVFVYINRQLVIDLGGVHSPIEDSVDLDAVASRIGLVSGETYELHFFFAERHEVDSNFLLETSLIFTDCSIPDVAR